MLARKPLIHGALTLPVLSMGLVGRAQSVALDESDSVLVQPILGRTPLADSITAFPTKDGALVPFGELCRLLAFGIVADPAKGRAEGFFIQEKRRFTLDLASRSVKSDGRIHTFTPTQVICRPGDIFVDARLLEAWFPVEIKVNLKLSALVIKPKERLPIQEQWEREGKSISATQGPDEHPVGSLLKSSYSLADMPFADVSANWNKSRGAFSGQPALSAYLTGDLLWMSSALRVAKDSHGHFENSSWTLFREDPGGKLLGPLHAKRLEIGSIQQAPSLGVAGTLLQGRGVLMDNYPLNYRSKFATRSFTGNLEDGWSVELYQNSGLLGFQKARADGRYEFKDIPLRFGLNQFRLVFHGPFGQTRIETSRVNIASDQPAPGELFYRVTGMRPLASQIQSDDAAPDRLEATRRKVSSLAQVEYGLSRLFAMSAGAAESAHLDGLAHRYTDVGIRGVFPYLSLQLDVARDQAPGLPTGTARGISLSTGYSYSTLTLEHSGYQNGFQTLDRVENTSITKRIASETRMEWDGTLGSGDRPLSLSLGRTQKKYEDGTWTATDTARTTLSYPSFTVTPTLTRTSESNQAGPASLSGSVFVTGAARGYSLQSELSGSRTADGTKLTGWGFQADSSPTNGFSHRFGAKGTDLSFDNITLLAGLSKLTGRYGYGVETQYSKTGGYSISLKAQASFGREPRSGKWVSDARAMAGQGAISAVAFMDANGNGKRDEGERILQETRFKVGNQASENAINDNQVFFRTGMPRNQETLVRVDDSTLEDPSYSSIVRGYRMVPRPGKVHRIDFPIAVFGEIDGTTCIRRAGGGTAEFGGLEIELLKADGQAFRVLRSAYDGYFEIRELPLGDYLLRVSPAEASRLRLKEMPPRRYHVDAVKNFYEGQYLTVEALPQEAPVDSPTAKATPAQPQDPPSTRR